MLSIKIQYKTKKTNWLLLLWRNNELFFWLTALVLLYTADLHTDFTLCIPSHLGFTDCWGCGIGHSITALMHGDFAQSWNYHWLGVFALGAILWHTARLTNKLINNIKEKL